MQARHRGVIRHADFDTELGKSVKSNTLGRPGVGRREQANGNVVTTSLLQRVEEEAHAVPANERNDEIDLVGGPDLLLQFRGEMRLAATVHQKVVGREGNLRSRRKLAQSKRIGRRNSDEQARRRLDLLVRAAKGSHEFADEPRSVSIVDVREVRGKDVGDVLSESMRLVGVIEFDELRIETDELACQPPREHRVVQTRSSLAPRRHAERLRRPGTAGHSVLEYDVGPKAALTCTNSCGPGVERVRRAHMGSDLHQLSALGGSRTPNLLIRSQMLYPLSYERWSGPV